MVWWIAAAVAGCGLAVLVVAAGLLLGRLARLRGLERALRRRAEQAQALQEPVLALQQQAESMQEQVLELQRWVEARAARRAAAAE